LHSQSDEGNPLRVDALHRHDVSFETKRDDHLKLTWRSKRGDMRLILILLAFLFLTAEAPSPWGIEELVNKQAPEFMLKDINGRDVALSSFKGKAVLINFWATWCPPCRAEMPALNKLYREYRDKGLTVIAVSTDRSMASVKNFLSKSPVDFPILMDPDGKVSRQFRVFSLPTSFLLDKNGIILQRYLGEEEWDSPGIRNKIREASQVP
jgi:peroxiredoxin